MSENIRNSRFSSLSRSEKSLTALTTKFMTLLQESHNGVLDLRSVKFFFFQTMNKFCDPYW